MSDQQVSERQDGSFDLEVKVYPMDSDRVIARELILGFAPNILIEFHEGGDKILISATMPWSDEAPELNELHTQTIADTFRELADIISPNQNSESRNEK